MMYKVLSLCFSALMLVILSGRPATGVPQGYLKGAILTDIKRLLDILPKDDDEGKLYTPDDIDVKCAREAMICYMTEIGAVAQEFEDRLIIRTTERIQRNIGAALNYTSNTKTTGRNSAQPAEPSSVTVAQFTSRREDDIASKTDVCLLCESHELRNTTTFLEHMIQFVQLALNDNGLKTQG